MSNPSDSHPPSLGLLHLCNPHARLTAFESGDIESPHTLIFIGGLGDGFCAVPYLNPLSESLEPIGWSITQVLLSSSYAGFGCSNVEQDSKELIELIEYLIRFGKTRFILMGHSTGCQDVVRLVNDRHDLFMKSTSGPIMATILQAPVSDREYISDVLGKESYERSIEIATESIKNGQPNHPIPSEYSELFSGGRCTISSKRWISLACRIEAELNPNGEDYFSSDLTEQELTTNLKAFEQIPTMILVSDRDESVPKEVNKQELLDRLTSVMGHRLTKAWSQVLDRAGHSAEEVIDELCERVVGFVRALT